MNLRLMVGIDDGGLQAAFPLMTDGFVTSADGSLIGEQESGPA
jgi:hypothetical protein